VKCPLITGRKPRQSDSRDHGALGIVDTPRHETGRGQPVRSRHPGDGPEEGHAGDPGEQPAPGATRNAQFPALSARDNHTLQKFPLDTDLCH